MCLVKVGRKTCMTGLKVPKYLIIDFFSKLSETLIEYVRYYAA